MTIEDGLEELAEKKEKQAEVKIEPAVPELVPVKKVLSALEMMRINEKSYLQDGKDYVFNAACFMQDYNEFMSGYADFIDQIRKSCAAIKSRTNGWDQRFEGLLSEASEKNKDITVPKITIKELTDEVDAALESIRDASMQASDVYASKNDKLERALHRINDLAHEIKNTDALTDLLILNRSLRDNANYVCDCFQVKCMTFGNFNDVKAQLKKIADFCNGKETVAYTFQHNHVIKLRDPTKKYHSLKRLRDMLKEIFSSDGGGGCWDL